ncbi:hypothetical protein HZB00_02715 [Candidatus Woesearchaeota archaeon]|nr:hypothetical protein [Candidatus Woesearchaeota archaeon]
MKKLYSIVAASFLFACSPKEKTFDCPDFIPSPNFMQEVHSLDCGKGASDFRLKLDDHEGEEALTYLKDGGLVFTRHFGKHDVRTYTDTNGDGIAETYGFDEFHSSYISPCNFHQLRFKQALELFVAKYKLFFPEPALYSKR